MKKLAAALGALLFAVPSFAAELELRYGALERIIGIAERVDRMIAQIAIAASQQANAADQSSSSLDSIHALSMDNLSEMATTTNGIENLRVTAAALASQVESFHLAIPKPAMAAGLASTGPRALPQPTLA